MEGRREWWRVGESGGKGGRGVDREREGWREDMEEWIGSE